MSFDPKDISHRKREGIASSKAPNATLLPAAIALKNWWFSNVSGLREARRGLLVVECPEPLDASWGEGSALWDPRADGTPSDGAAVAILPWIDETLRADITAVSLTFTAALTARSRGLAILASTSLTLNQFKGLDKSTDTPPQLNVNSLLLPSELAYYLSTCCVVRRWGENLEPDVPEALYLTPIERRMAEALKVAKIPFAPQKPVGPYRVDFLVDNRLIVECDGAAFHDPEKDKVRDRTIEQISGLYTLRFSGREIFQVPQECIARLRQSLKFLPRPKPAGSFALTPAQQAAVNHELGPALVAAPAGSGKTRVIDRRIRRLVANGVSPTRICAISLTNKAVEEMKERLADIEGITFSTLHSLANSICTEFIGTRANIQSASPGQPTRWTVIRSLLRPEEISIYSSYTLWTEAISEYREGFRTPDLSGLGVPGAISEQEKRFLAVHKAYDALLAERKWTDFEGMIWDAIRIFAGDPVKRLGWSGRFDYWVVDEFQDLPAAKLKLLRLLVSPARNLFAVGDDDQTIYGFAGASPNAFRLFQQQWPDVRLYTLDKNFRCPHDLVVRTGWLIGRNKNRIPKTVVPVKEMTAEPSVILESHEPYDKAGLTFVQNQLGSGRQAGEIALLFRLRDMSIPLQIGLSRAGIPFIGCTESRSFFDQPFPKTILSWLRIANGQGGPDDWRRALRVPNRYLSSAAIDWLTSGQDIEQTIRGGAVDATEVPLGNERQKASMVFDALCKFISILEKAREASPNPTAMLEAVDFRSALQAANSSRDDSRAPLKQASPLVALEILARCASNFSTLIEFEQWIGNYRTNKDFASVESLVEEQPSVSVGKVLLTTIHQAKGREYPAVGVLGPADGMPDSRAETIDELEEERRIAYVAATRATKVLLFCCSAKYSEELKAQRITTPPRPPDIQVTFGVAPAIVPEKPTVPLGLGAAVAFESYSGQLIGYEPDFALLRLDRGGVIQVKYGSYIKCEGQERRLSKPPSRLDK